MTSLAQDLSLIAGRGFAWWTGELASLVPKWWRDGGRQAQNGTVVAVHQGKLSLVNASGRAAPAGSSQTEALSEQTLLEGLARQSRPGVTVPVRLRLPYGACLTRRIEIPERARAEAGRILALDLERATSLSAGEVYTAHYEDNAAAAKGSVGYVQLIVKKATIDTAVARIEAAGAMVNAVDCWSADGTAVLPINFLEHSLASAAKSQTPGRGLTRALAVAAVGLALSSIWISMARHKSALSELESQTEAARASLAGIETARGTSQMAAKEAQAIVVLKAERPMTVQILDELTRLLPDTVYLSEFSADGDTVAISGFAKSASGLVPILGRSQMFADATLIAPVTFDDARNKERFSYRLRLRAAKPVPPSEAAP